MDYYSLKDVFYYGNIDYDMGDNNIINNYHRRYIESGFDTWRAVVKKLNQTSIFKLICYQFDGNDTFHGGSRIALKKNRDQRFLLRDENKHYELLLFDIQNDIYEQSNLIFNDENRKIVQTLHKLIPSRFCGSHISALQRVHEYQMHKVV